MATSKVTGTYILDGSGENFDAFMKALGVNMITRKLATATTPTVYMTEKEGTYTMKTTSTVKNFEISFKIGKEFDETASDGRQCKTTISLDGDNKLVQVQKAEKGKDAKFTRVFTDTHMNMDCECEGIVCKRIYKRI